MVILQSDALIVVDVQNDFCPGGALAVEAGDQIIAPINALMTQFEHVVYTRDWHPQNHCSFDPNPSFQNRSWPVHCVQYTDGAAFHPALGIRQDRLIVSKGMDPSREAYSGFEGTDLHHILREKNVEQVFVCGLATDYCVKNTALDAARMGYGVVVLEDLCRGVSQKTVDEARREMGDAGIVFQTVGDGS